MSKINKSRKFFATAATAALVASAIVPVASAASYTDADKIAPWATEAVDLLSEQGVIGGNPDGSFNPRGNITRGEAAKMFTAALNLSTDGTEDFKDVFAKDWYYGPIVAVSNAGIVNGIGAGLFAPKANLTRAEAAKMIVLAYGLTGEADLSKFADAKNVSGKWYEEVLSTAVANGVINGKDGKLAPSDSITRQEFAVMFKRAIDVTEKVDYAAELANALTDLEKATKALDAEVKIETIEETKKAVATAKKAITVAQTALETAVKEEAITTETATKAQATITKATEAVKATEAKIAKVEEAAKELTVESITGMSATQVAIKFSKAVDKDSLFKDGIKGELATGDTVTIKPLDGNEPGKLKGELSEDGKTLVITTEKELEKRYDFTVKGLKSTDGKKLKEHKQTVKIEADTTAPTIVGTEQIATNKVKVKFSEPVQGHTGTLKYADGAKIATVEVADGATSVIVDLAAKDIKVNTPMTVTFNGLKDVAGNLLSPNPATVTVTKLPLDGILPTVSTITQTGANTFTVKFSKDLGAKPAVTVTKSTVTNVKKVADNEYKVTTENALKGIQKVTVDNIKDLSGQKGDAVTKNVTFNEDITAPKATSVNTVTVDGIEYLELTFDKEVTEGKVKVSGSYNKNFISKDVEKTVNVKYASKSNKKVVRIALKDFATEEGAAYTVEIKSETVKSLLADVKVADTKATFTRGKDNGSNVTKLGAPAVASVDNKTVTVTFTGEVDGESATNIANYTVDGAEVQSATLAKFDKDTKKQVVTLKFKQDSIAFTGEHKVTVQNVKALGSTVTMDKFIDKVELNENVRPTVLKAELDGSQNIILTFSESVKGFDDEKGDFALFIGGKKSPIAVTDQEEVAGSDRTKIVLTLDKEISSTDLSEGLTIKSASTINITDDLNYELNFTSIDILVAKGK
ncbi:S-layer homology domain-containing protein [Solibacillus sp. FSL K6-1523]|uniref:S-layer homology domain-containing protein n=1 Tax=Solibacillus sp. FSL K6-1523 TaxID=2921471 RepID=UPI0030FCDDE1